MPIMVIGPSIAYVPLPHGFYAVIDSWNAGRVGTTNWHYSVDANTGSKYAKRNVPCISKASKQTCQMLHNLVLENKAGFSVDHKDILRTLDCREANLRYANRSQQVVNQRKKRTNTSGYKGVYRHAAAMKWCAQIGVDGKRVYLGYFDTKELAYEAYCKAAEIYHGEFRRTA